MCSAIILGFFRDLSLQRIPWYVGFFPCEGWFFGFSFAEEKRLCTEYWMFYSRRVVSEEAYCLFFFLAEPILSDPNCKYHGEA